jgi:two-component system KDP operon response regulator KdpE
MISEIRPDMVIFDPRCTSETPDELRGFRGSGVGVIILSTKDSDQDVVKGLNSGADDYVAKPFSPDELAARVRAVLRVRMTGRSDPASVIQSGDITIDLARRLVRRAGVLIPMTRTEWLLLQTLASNPDKVMLCSEMLTKVWGQEYKGDLQYLRVWVSRLRRKLEAEPSRPQVIQTFHGIGYMFSTGAPKGRDETLEVDGHPTIPLRRRTTLRGEASESEVREFAIA